MRLGKLVHEGFELPRGYGVAWRCYDRYASVCYPVPFNLVARWLRDLYVWARCIARPSYSDRVLWRAFNRGRDIGIELGREHALRELWEAEKRELINEWDASVDRWIARGKITEDTRALSRAASLP